MALEDITSKIIADAKQKAKRIDEAANEEIKTLKKQSHEELKQLRLTMMQSAKSKAADKLQGQVTVQRITGKNLILETKRQAISKAFESAVSDLRTLPDSKYQMLLKPQVHTVAGLSQNLTIISDKMKSDLIEKTLRAKLVGKNLSFKVSDKVMGGFMVETEHSTVDLSFASILEEKRTEIESLLNAHYYKL